MSDHATAQDPGPDPDCVLGAQVRSAVGRLDRRFRAERPDGTLGDTALAVLTRLHKYGPQSLTDLSEHDHVSLASMSQTVNRLAAAGYVVRNPDTQDRRKVLFTPTEEGNQLAGSARAQRNAWLDDQLAALSPKEREVIAQASILLRRIADACAEKTETRV
jgi:DNA-binding MarR family transcriptional regulator